MSVTLLVRPPGLQHLPGLRPPTTCGPPASGQLPGLRLNLDKFNLSKLRRVKKQSWRRPYRILSAVGVCGVEERPRYEGEGVCFRAAVALHTRCNPFCRGRVKGLSLVPTYQSAVGSPHRRLELLAKIKLESPKRPMVFWNIQKISSSTRRSNPKMIKIFSKNFYET